MTEKSIRRPELPDAILALLQDGVGDPLVPGITATILAPRRNIDSTQSTPHSRHPGVSGQFLSVMPFRIASITKSFVAAAILRLAETERLGLEDRVSDHLLDGTRRELERAGYDLSSITVRQVMAHTAGLRDHMSDEYKLAVIANPGRTWTPAEQLAFSASLGGPLFEPGKNFSYADLGYVLLGELLEQVSGEPMALAVRSLLDFERLELTSTWWESREAVPPGLPPVRAQFLGEIDARSWDPSFDLFGGGGLVSTTRDLARAMRAMIRGEVFRRPETLSAALWVPVVPRQADANLHGLLAMCLPFGPFAGWGHTGFWGCAAAHIPDKDITIALTIDQATPQQTGLLRMILEKLSILVAESSAGGV